MLLCLTYTFWISLWLCNFQPWQIWLWFWWLLTVIGSPDKCELVILYLLHFNLSLLASDKTISCLVHFKFFILYQMLGGEDCFKLKYLIHQFEVHSNTHSFCLFWLMQIHFKIHILLSLLNRFNFIFLMHFCLFHLCYISGIPINWWCLETLRTIGLYFHINWRCFEN